MKRLSPLTKFIHEAFRQLAYSPLYGICFVLTFGPTYTFAEESASSHRNMAIMQAIQQTMGNIQKNRQMVLQERQAMQQRMEVIQRLEPKTILPPTLGGCQMFPAEHNHLYGQCNTKGGKEGFDSEVSVPPITAGQIGAAAAGFIQNGVVPQIRKIAKEYRRAITGGAVEGKAVGLQCLREMRDNEIIPELARRQEAIDNLIRKINAQMKERQKALETQRQDLKQAQMDLTGGKDKQGNRKNSLIISQIKNSACGAVVANVAPDFLKLGIEGIRDKIRDGAWQKATSYKNSRRTTKKLINKRINQAKRLLKDNHFEAVGPDILATLGNDFGAFKEAKSEIDLEYKFKMRRLNRDLDTYTNAPYMKFDINENFREMDPDKLSKLVKKKEKEWIRQAKIDCMQGLHGAPGIPFETLYGDLRIIKEGVSVRDSINTIKTPYDQIMNDARSGAIKNLRELVAKVKTLDRPDIFGLDPKVDQDGKKTSDTWSLTERFEFIRQQCEGADGNGGWFATRPDIANSYSPKKMIREALASITKYKNMHKEYKSNFVSKIKDRLITCTSPEVAYDGTPSSCNESAMDSKSPGFCMANADKCYKSMDSCLNSTLETFHRQATAKLQQKAAAYEAKVDEFYKLQQGFVTQLAGQMSSYKQFLANSSLPGLFAVGSRPGGGEAANGGTVNTNGAQALINGNDLGLDLNLNAPVSVLGKIDGVAIDAEIPVEDPMQMANKMKEQLEKLSSQLKDTQDKVVGFFNEKENLYKNFYEQEIAWWSNLKSGCEEMVTNWQRDTMEQQKQMQDQANDCLAEANTYDVCPMVDGNSDSHIASTGQSAAAAVFRMPGTSGVGAKPLYFAYMDHCREEGAFSDTGEEVPEEDRLNRRYTRLKSFCRNADEEPIMQDFPDELDACDNWKSARELGDYMKTEVPSNDNNKWEMVALLENHSEDFGLGTTFPIASGACKVIDNPDSTTQSAHPKTVEDYEKCMTTLAAKAHEEDFDIEAIAESSEGAKFSAFATAFQDLDEQRIGIKEIYTTRSPASTTTKKPRPVIMTQFGQRARSLCHQQSGQGRNMYKGPPGIEEMLTGSGLFNTGADS